MRSSAAADRDGERESTPSRNHSTHPLCESWPRLEDPSVPELDHTLQKPPCNAASLHLHPLQSQRLSVAASLGELQIVGSFSSLTRLDSKAKLPLCISWSAIASISSTFNCLSANGSPDLLQWKVTTLQAAVCSFSISHSPAACFCLCFVIWP